MSVKKGTSLRKDVPLAVYRYVYSILLSLILRGYQSPYEIVNQNRFDHRCIP